MKQWVSTQTEPPFVNHAFVGAFTAERVGGEEQFLFALSQRDGVRLWPTAHTVTLSAQPPESPLDGQARLKPSGLTEVLFYDDGFRVRVPYQTLRWMSRELQIDNERIIHAHEMRQDVALAYSPPLNAFVVAYVESAPSAAAEDGDDASSDTRVCLRLLPAQATGVSHAAAAGHVTTAPLPQPAGSRLCHTIPLDPWEYVCHIALSPDCCLLYVLTASNVLVFRLLVTDGSIDARLAGRVLAPNACPLTHMQPNPYCAEELVSIDATAAIRIHRVHEDSVELIHADDSAPSSSRECVVPRVAFGYSSEQVLVPFGDELWAHGRDGTRSLLARGRGGSDIVDMLVDTQHGRLFVLTVRDIMVLQRDTEQVLLCVGHGRDDDALFLRSVYTTEQESVLAISTNTSFTVTVHTIGWAGAYVTTHRAWLMPFLEAQAPVSLTCVPCPSSGEAGSIVAAVAWFGDRLQCRVFTTFAPEAQTDDTQETHLQETRLTDPNAPIRGQYPRSSFLFHAEGATVSETFGPKLLEILFPPAPRPISVASASLIIREASQFAATRHGYDMTLLDVFSPLSQGEGLASAVTSTNPPHTIPRRSIGGMDWEGDEGAFGAQLASRLARVWKGVPAMALPTERAARFAAEAHVMSTRLIPGSEGRGAAEVMLAVEKAKTPAAATAAASVLAAFDTCVEYTRGRTDPCRTQEVTTETQSQLVSVSTQPPLVVNLSQTFNDDDDAADDGNIDGDNGGNMPSPHKRRRLNMGAPDAMSPRMAMSQPVPGRFAPRHSSPRPRSKRRAGF